MDSQLEEYIKNPLWPVLVETVHALVMFPHHKGYVREVLMVDNMNISAGEIQTSLNISLGEALVIFYELKLESENKKSQEDSENPGSPQQEEQKE